MSSGRKGSNFALTFSSILHATYFRGMKTFDSTSQTYRTAFPTNSCRLEHNWILRSCINDDRVSVGLVMLRRRLFLDEKP